MSRLATTDERLQELRQPFDALAQMIRLRASGRRVCFLRGDGNFGDGLIRHAAELFLSDIGISPLVLDMSSRRQKTEALARGLLDPYGRRMLFIFNGGGGWAEHCSTGLRVVGRQLMVCADMIVLPTTIEQMPLRRRPTIYARDRAESHDLLPDAAFCHDMAFYLSLVPQERWFDDGRDISVEREIGLFFRRDNESRMSAGCALPGNDDLSMRGNHASDIQVFLREIAKCDHVITDRLHVAIGGVLLGRKVSLVEGKTFKIRAIYEASIAPYFTNCELVSDNEAVRRALRG